MNTQPKIPLVPFVLSVFGALALIGGCVAFVISRAPPRAWAGNRTEGLSPFDKFVCATLIEQLVWLVIGLLIICLTLARREWSYRAALVSFFAMALSKAGILGYGLLSLQHPRLAFPFLSGWSYPTEILWIFGIMCAAVPAVLLLPPIPRRAARIIVVSVLTLAILHGISNLYGLSFQAGRMDWVLTYFPQGYQELIYLVLWLLIDNMRAAIAAKHSE